MKAHGQGPHAMMVGGRVTADQLLPHSSADCRQKFKGAPCVDRCGPGWGGAFRRVHNGIEYAYHQMMRSQRAVRLLAAKAPARSGALFERWQKGPLGLVSSDSTDAAGIADNGDCLSNLRQR